VQVQNKSGDMARALARTTGAIGMTTATVVEQSGGVLTALALNGVAPTPANVQTNRYRMVRDAFLVTAGQASPAVAAFLAFVAGGEGAKVIAANGAIAVKPYP
jgi:ABC-type phosphate transport system substrate-binding protein